MSTEGAGTALIQLSCKYLTEKVPENQVFSIDFSYGPNTCEEFLQLNICVNYFSANAIAETNLVYMKVKLPSGFIYQEETSRNEKLKVKNLKRI